MKLFSGLVLMAALSSSGLFADTGATSSPRDNERLVELIRTYISIQGPIGKLKARDGVDPDSVGSFDLEFTFDELQSFSNYVKKLDSADELLIEREMLRQGRLSLGRADLANTDAKNNEMLTRGLMYLLEGAVSFPILSSALEIGRIVILRFTKGSFASAWMTPRSPYYNFFASVLTLSLFTYLVVQTYALPPLDSTAKAQSFRDAFENYLIDREAEFQEKALMLAVPVPPKG